MLGIRRYIQGFDVPFPPLIAPLHGQQEYVIDRQKVPTAQ
jgi:hypothetical protein